MPTYQTSNPLARTNPLRSIPLIRPVAAVLGITDQAKAEWALMIAHRDVPLLEARYAAYCDALGNANKLRGPMRRHWQAKAFRQINSARAQLRAARKALIAAEATMLHVVLPLPVDPVAAAAHRPCRHPRRAEPGNSPKQAGRPGGCRKHLPGLTRNT